MARSLSVDGLVGGQAPPVLHGATDVPPLDGIHLQGHQAVVDEDLLAGLELLVELFIGHGDMGAVPHLVPGGEGEGVAGLQTDGFLGEGPDADLRPLGVQNGGHGTPHGVPDGLEQGEPLQVLLVAPVGEVEPGRVHPGADQGADHLLAVHGGA